jgi:hypothetical protein
MWRKDRCLEGIIQTSLIVMIPNFWPLRFLYFTTPTIKNHYTTHGLLSFTICQKSQPLTSNKTV